MYTIMLILKLYNGNIINFVNIVIIISRSNFEMSHGQQYSFLNVKCLYDFWVGLRPANSFLSIQYTFKLCVILSNTMYNILQYIYIRVLKYGLI